MNICFVLHGAIVPHSYNSGLSLPLLYLLGNKLPRLSGPLLGSCVFIIKPIIPCDHNSTKETELEGQSKMTVGQAVSPEQVPVHVTPGKCALYFLFRRLKFSSAKRELAANRV